MVTTHDPAPRDKCRLHGPYTRPRRRAGQLLSEPGPACPVLSADFRAAVSALWSGEVEAESAACPPGDGGGGREVGAAKDGGVGPPVDLDDDRVVCVDDFAWGVEEAALQGVGGGGVVVAGQAQAEG